MKKLLVCIITVFFLFNISKSQELLWAVETDTLGFAWGISMVLGDDNNVYVGGEGEQGMYLLQYDNHGSIEFANVDMGDGNFGGITSGSNGYIYMVGEKDNGQHDDAVLHVYEADGTPVFTQVYDLNNRDDDFVDVCVDQSNNIYVCGNGWTSGSDQVALVVKYAPSGLPLWVQEYGEAYYHCRFKFIQVSENGNVYAIGEKNYSGGGTPEIIMFTYDENGNLISEYIGIVGGYSTCYPSFALLDDEENIYIGGKASEWFVASAGFLIQISNGIQTWSQILPAGGVNNEIEGGAFDQDGNIICYGITYDDDNDNAYYAKFSTGGGLLNEAIYDSPYQMDDAFSDVYVKDEFVYFSGGSEGQGTNGDMIALKINADFELMWEIRYNSFDNGWEGTHAMVVDNDDHVLLSGFSVTTSGVVSSLVKFSNPLGIDDFIDTKTLKLEVFPNPASSMLNFEIEVERKDARYIISNTYGQIVQSGYINDAPTQQISLIGMHAGAYFLQILDGKKQYNAKFVKQ